MSEARPMRADARRKREAVLAAAGEVFLERGIDVALDEIARRAGVGIGTLYRHFPTREALVVGAYVRHMDLLCDEVDGLLSELPPDEALVTWMQRFIGHAAEQPGMAVALKAVVHAADSEAVRAGHERVFAALRTLLDAAERAGTVRPGVSADDLAGALSGFSLITGRPGSRERSDRLVALLVDGLRLGAPGPG
ncbi:MULTISPECIES: TetR/AcrR family transcriptional regulator [unclassified Streptomyces]|uniref:TetR/AcrR family transcriptional regulator n=1 Tax=unclassified Streptomyces TaxID=2593676 RepID=UPI003804F0E6